MDITLQSLKDCATASDKCLILIVEKLTREDERKNNDQRKLVTSVLMKFFDGFPINSLHGYEKQKIIQYLNDFKRDNL